MAEIINGKVLYTPKGAALEYGRVGCNFYKGCPHGCEYCYLKRGVTAKELGGLEVQLKKSLKDTDTAFEIFKREAERHLSHLRETGVFFSFTCDPLIRETQTLTTHAVKWLNEHDVATQVLTKNASFMEDLYFQDTVLDAPDFRKDIAHFGFTLTGRDDMEPGASTNDDRIWAMGELHKAGLPTFASIEPVIDWPSTERVIRDSIDHCDHYKIGLRSGVKRDYYKPGEVFERIRAIVDFISGHGKTVYLKRSVCDMIGDSNLFTFDDYQRIIRLTVDSNGNPRLF